MIDAKYVANEANTVIKKMIKGWQKEPLMFFSEHDVQAEIFSHLKDWLKKEELYLVKGIEVENEKYKKKCRIENEAGQKWHRLHCEVHLKCKERSRGIRPDIIIWDDLESYIRSNEEKYREIVYNFSNNWPMIWACEIKYYHGGAKQTRPFTKEEMEKKFNNVGGQDKDKKNLHLLLEQGKEKVKNQYFGTNYATILNVYRRNVESDKCCYEKEDIGENGTEIKIINAFLAVEKNNKTNDS